MNQQKPVTETVADNVAEITKRGRINNPFAKNASTDSTEKVDTKDVKSKVKTALAVVGAGAIGLVAVGAIAKRKTNADSVSVDVSLPSIDVSSDAPSA